MPTLHNRGSFDRAIDGWKKYISPHTPEHIFDCPPWDPVRNYVCRQLLVMIKLLEGADPKQIAAASSQIVPLWPSIWTWLQVLYAEGKSYASIPKPPGSISGPVWANRVLFAFLHTEPRTPLSTMVAKTGGLKAMIATMWIDEGTDNSAATDCRGASILFQSNFPFAPPLLIPEILIKCGGQTDIATKILLWRIKENAKRAEPDLAALRFDNSLLIDQLELHHTGSKILRPAILSYRMFVMTMVDVLSLLLTVKESYPTKPITDLLAFQLDIIFRHFQTTGYECVVQLTRTTIFGLVVQLAQSNCGSDHRIVAASTRLLRTVLCRFGVYRSILLAMLHRIKESNMIDYKKTGPVNHGNCLAGPELRFLSHVVTGQLVQLIGYSVERGYFRCSSSDHSHITLGQPRKVFLFLDYAHEEDKITQNPVVPKVMDFEDFDTKATLRKSAPNIKFTKEWHAAWSRSVWPPSSFLGYVVPVFVYLPSEWEKPEAITALGGIYWDKRGNGQFQVHIRWIHRM
ncbi:hypothetical protein HWV62_16538 [Athelia sp. TMB]|nr:hypothetical protein HWV62_16538 [Athelia sp. TMB]